MTFLQVFIDLIIFILVFNQPIFFHISYMRYKRFFGNNFFLINVPMEKTHGKSAIDSVY